MTSRNWLIPIATGAVCLAAGMFIARGPGDPPAEERPAPVVDPRGTSIVPPAGAFTLDDVRRVVREELAARQQQSAEQSRRAEETAVEPPTGEQVAAASQAEAVLQAAIARRSWTAADADAIRRDFHAMTPDQQAELMRRFSLAINQGQIVPDAELMPF